MVFKTPAPPDLLGSPFPSLGLGFPISHAGGGARAGDLFASLPCRAATDTSFF